MIVKIQWISDTEKLVYIIKNSYLYVLYEKDDVRSLIKKVPVLQEKPKLKVKEKSFFSRRFLCLLLGYTLAIHLNSMKLIAMNPICIKHYISWSKDDEETKAKHYINDNQEMLEKNQNLTELERKMLIEKYAVYVDRYMEYLTKEEYFNSLKSSAFIETQPMQKESYSLEDDSVELVGQYNAKNQTIYYASLDEDILFHEKLHADNYIPSFTTMDSLLEEMKSSIGADYGYVTLVVSFDLLSELIGKEPILEAVFTKNEKILSKALNETFKDNPNEVKAIQKCLIEHYIGGYEDHQNTFNLNEKVQEFLDIYQILYQKKYGYSPEEDVLASYKIDMLLENVPFQNGLTNETNYRLLDQIPFEKEDRHHNYRDNVVEKCKDYINYLNYFYQDVLKQSRDEEWTYEDFEQYLKPYFTQKEIIILFQKLLSCPDIKTYKKYENFIFTRKMNPK